MVVLEQIVFAPSQIGLPSAICSRWARDRNVLLLPRMSFVWLRRECFTEKDSDTAPRVRGYKGTTAVSEVPHCLLWLHLWRSSLVIVAVVIDKVACLNCAVITCS